MSTFRTPHAGFGDPRWPFLEGALHLTAGGLMRASAVLSRIAMRLLSSAPRPAHTPFQLEFHAGVDGEDGDLYLDGVWVGRIAGVTRL